MKKIICFVLTSFVFVGSLSAKELSTKELSRKELSPSLSNRASEEMKLDQGLQDVELAKDLRPINDELFFGNFRIGSLSNTTFIMPSIGLGGRYQKKSFGFDATLDFNSLLIINVFTLRGSGLYFFPHSDFNKQFYAGLGVGSGVGLIITPFGGGVGMLPMFSTFTLGKKLSQKSYFQVDVFLGYFDHYNGRFASGFGEHLPLVEARLGFGF